MAWDVQESIAESRRACGGLGYSYHSLFGIHLGINDLNQTWEGDNHVLMMQTQQFLFTALKWLAKGEEMPETCEFLESSPPDMEEHNCCIHDLKGLQSLFKARACYMVHKASQVMMSDPSKVAENFNNYQQFDLREMSQAYFDTYILDTALNWISIIEDKGVVAVYEKLLLLHVQNNIVKNEIFYSPILGDEKIDKAKRSIMDLLKDLRNEVLALTKVLPFPNNSYGMLGNEDLQLYERVLQHVKSTEKVSERPNWWKLSYVNSEK